MSNLGQLIKLQDYISRYETDIYRYPSQFIRVKQQQWDKVKSEWESFPFTKKLKQIDQLKQGFLDSIFPFQLKWASSTVRDKSFIDQEFYEDQNLKYFLQSFPDTYFLLYKPVFLIKNAPVELDIIFISPICTWCITLIEGEDNSVFLGSNERFWIEKSINNEKKVLSPLIGLDRTEKIVRKVYEVNKIEMPVKKVLLNRTGYFDYPYPPYDLTLIDKKVYDDWFQSLRSVSSPLKSIQLKAAKTLLSWCASSYIRRQF